MAFNDEVVKDGKGRIIRVDGSIDGFATTPYRYADVAGLLDGASQWSNRVVSLDNVRRGLGQDRVVTSGTTALILNNADGAMDWICGSDNIATAAKLRLRIYIGLYTPKNTPLDFVGDTDAVWKLLGEFVLSEWPSQDNETVTLSLADDMMGRLGPGLLLPTIGDWAAVGAATTNPLFYSTRGLPTSITLDTPIQLAFGGDWVRALPHIIPDRNNGLGMTYANSIIVPLYSTTDTTAVSQALIAEVRIKGFKFRYPVVSQNLGDETTTEIELSGLFRTTWEPHSSSGPGTEVTVWRVEKSPSISKGGKTFQIVYLVVRCALDRAVHSSDYGVAADPGGWGSIVYDQALNGGYAPEVVENASISDSQLSSGHEYETFAARVNEWYFRGFPLSQRTNAPSTDIGAHPVDVITDLVSVYTTATVDTTEAARVKSANPFLRCAGVIQPWTDFETATVYRPLLSLRQVLTDIAKSADIDIFLNWAGQVSFASDVMDFTTATHASTLIEIPESALTTTRRWVPGTGERHATYNRVFFRGAHKSPAQGYDLEGIGDDIPFQGPFDLPSPSIPIETRIIEIGLEQGWQPFLTQVKNPFQYRGIEFKARDMVAFRTNISGLRLELGMYFKLNWTRGNEIGGPYSSTIFQCDSITYAPGDDSVEIEAVWRDDTASDRSYILDDESMIVRTKDATGTCASNGTDLLVFAGTDMENTGVQQGDIIVLRDSTQSETNFSRNAAFFIDDVPNPNQLTVIDSTGAAAAIPAATVANADWYIVRGATTYHTAVSSPTNYPSGGTMYGKVTKDSTTGAYIYSTVGNRLISG